ncbi:MAG: DUF4167 domain-containing protein [bacterium]
MAQNTKRGRNNQRRRQGNNANRALDSNGPDVKIRGTAIQIYDKYIALARDASTSGDRIRAESLLQHAEHYYRIMKAAQAQADAQRQLSKPASQEEQPDMPAKAEARDDSGEDKSEDAEPPIRKTRTRRKKAEASDPSAEDKAEDNTEEKPKRTRRKRITKKEAVTDSEGVSEAVAAE